MDGFRLICAVRWEVLGWSVFLAASAAAEPEPFAAISVGVPGRPVQIESGHFGGNCVNNSLDWIVVSISGQPPDEIRSISVFPCGPPGVIATAPRRELVVPASDVAFDLADVDGDGDDELLLLADRSIAIHDPMQASPPRVVRLPQQLPLPPRTRGLTRMHFTKPWNGGKRPLALLPTISGGVLIDLLGSAPPQAIPLPRVAEYDTADPVPPVHDELLTAEVMWPAFEMADDDGDGRPDLIAMSRYAVWIFHTGPLGLPSRPTRELPLRAFTLEEELRYETTSMRTFSRDLDGDGLSDLVVDWGAGSLLGGHHTTEIHRNSGSGVRSLAHPSARIDAENAIGSIQIVDLDGDGRLEILHWKMRFGLLQLARLLVTRRAEAQQRVYAFRGAEMSQLETTWKGSLSLGLDFAGGRAADLLPTALGDWNGDGWRDLLYGSSGNRLTIRLGVPGPGFGPQVASQRLLGEGPAGDVHIADLDGDGLDDIAIYDPHSRAGKIQVLRNLGRLQDTPSRLTARE